MALAMLTEEEKDRLLALVARHKAVWEVYPEDVLVNGKKRQVGYDIKLYGTHGQVPHTPTAGCEECGPVWEDLQRIVLGCLPPAGRMSDYEIQPYRPSLTYTKARDNRPDVELVLCIGHRQGDFLAPADPCESRCLHEIVADLRALGVQEKKWDDHVHDHYVAQRQGRRDPPAPR